MDKVRAQVCQGAGTRASTMGRCALERGHVALLEPLAQLGDALRGVGAAAFIIEAAELVPGQAATREREECQWDGADRKANKVNWHSNRP